MKQWRLNNKSRRAIYAERYHNKIEGRYSHYKAIAKYRGIPFLLTLEEFSEITKNSCFYCGDSGKVGIDRFDNQIGYALENCRSCCRICNRLKNDLPIDKFLECIRKIYNRFYI